jgi:hypothetical protein
MKDQFNGNTEKRHPPPHLIGMKSMKWLRMSMLSFISRKELGRILKKMTCGRSSQFLGATVLDRLRRPSFHCCDARQEEFV